MNREQRGQRNQGSREAEGVQGSNHQQRATNIEPLTTLLLTTLLIRFLFKICLRYALEQIKQKLYFLKIS